MNFRKLELVPDNIMHEFFHLFSHIAFYPFMCALNGLLGPTFVVFQEMQFKYEMLYRKTYFSKILQLFYLCDSLSQ